MAKAPKTNNFFVIDTLARDAERTHTIGGVPYKLDATQKREVPMAHALQFLNASPAFKVYDQDGVELERQVARHGASGPGVTLRAHETIATYAELSTTALLSRAKKFPEGLKFASNTKREDLINFLQGNGTSPVVSKIDPDIGAGSDLDDDDAGGDDLIEDDDDDDGVNLSGDDGKN